MVGNKDGRRLWFSGFIYEFCGPEKGNETHYNKAVQTDSSTKEKGGRLLFYGAEKKCSRRNQDQDGNGDKKKKRPEVEVQEDLSKNMETGRLDNNAPWAVKK